MYESDGFGKDLKIVLVGNVSTGKTSIIDRYVNKIFHKKKKATISPNFSYKLIQIDNINYRLQFWDIPGQDRSPSLTSVFCRDAHGFIFCCDCIIKNTRNDILNWKKNIENFIDISNIPTIIMENKCDLLGDESKYEDDIDELNNFSTDNNFFGAFRTSALNGYNIDKAVNFLIDEIIKNLDEGDIQSVKEQNKQGKNLNKSSNTNDKAKRCC